MKLTTVGVLALIVLLIAFVAPMSQAQSYYPLQIGNRWVYSDTTYEVGVGGTRETTSVSIVGDTAMSNGQHYFRFQGNEAAGAIYARADSNWIYYYNYFQSKDMPFFKLNAIVSEQWSVNLGPWFFVTYIGRDSITAFGRQITIIEYLLDGLAITYVFLSDKFGPIFIEDLFDPPGIYVTERRLIGAVIADTVYGTVVSVREPYEIPSGFSLKQNFPNPFNPKTTIEFSIPHTSMVTLKVFDLLGREVEVLHSGELQVGTQSVAWEPHTAASGVYFYRLQTPDFVETKSMLVLR